MTVSLRRPRPSTTADGAAAIHLPLFEELVGSLETSGRRSVLDLGAASSGLLALLGSAGCRAEIVDLAHFGGIDALNAAEPGPTLDDVAEMQLPERQPDAAIDLVFCWDIPNYLELASLTALMAAIGRRARRGALAHALVYYAELQMPERPGRFVPQGAGEVIDRRPQSKPVPAPRYSPEDLGRGMAPFAVDRARLLGNGTQEFLFQLR